MTVLGRYEKQPAEVLDYDVGCNLWLEGRTDAPVDHEVIAPDGITVENSLLLGNVVKVIVSGGTHGVTYKFTVRVMFDTGLKKEGEFIVKVKET